MLWKPSGLPHGELIAELERESSLGSCARKSEFSLGLAVCTWLCRVVMYCVWRRIEVVYLNLTLFPCMFEKMLLSCGVLFQLSYDGRFWVQWNFVLAASSSNDYAE